MRLSARPVLAFFFFSINFWCLSLDLTGTSQRTVDFTTEKSWLSCQVHIFEDTGLFQCKTSLKWSTKNFTRWNHIHDFISGLNIDNLFVEADVHFIYPTSISVRQSKSDSKMG